MPDGESQGWGLYSPLYTSNNISPSLPASPALLQWCLYVQSGKDLLSHLPGQAVLGRAALSTASNVHPHPQGEERRFIPWWLSSCPGYGLKPRIWLPAPAQHVELPPSDLGRQLQCENEVALINLKKKKERKDKQYLWGRREKRE